MGGGRMKKKINLQLLGVTFAAILLTLVMVSTVFYEIFKKEIISQLNNDAKILSGSQFFEVHDVNKVEPHALLDNLRVTIIDQKGNVLYDNYADNSTMGNHSERPEIIEALGSGEGMSIRRSTTLRKDTFYYALRQKDGTILRVAKEADSIGAIFTATMPVLFGIIIGLFAICVIIAHYLTKSLVSPIEQIANNIEECGNISTYKELVPFITTIQEQHKDILKSAKMRQEFTANVSHELKTPLTSISGYAELIANDMGDKEDVKRFAREIQRNSKRLLRLINDIIKLSELDSEDIEVKFEQVDLLEVARETIEMLQLNANKHEVAIKLEGVECFVWGNRSLIEELIYNLCDNAIRYNNKGGKVEVKIYSKAERNILIVKDTGIGISKKDQERIFERFYRVDKSRSKLTGGTGLGLAIVKHIVAQHKAELHIESEVDKGTMISIGFLKK